MATSAASATGSDSNRTAFTRNRDSGSESNRARLDGVSLSAFDLLLELPIFENQTPRVQAEPETTALEESNDDEKPVSEDDDKSLAGPSVNQNLAPLPIANRIEETLQRDSTRDVRNDRIQEPTPVPSIREPNKNDTQDQPVLQATNDSLVERPTEITTAETIDVSQSRPKGEPDTELAVPFEGEQQERVTTLERGGLEQDQQRKEEPVVDAEAALLDRNGKASKARSLDAPQGTQLSNEASQVEKASDSKQPAKRNDREEDSGLLDRTQSSTPFINRRADRLAEAKRGEQSKNESEQSKNDNSESYNSASGIEIPTELAVEIESNAPSQTITAPSIAIDSQSTDPTQSVSEIIATSQSTTTPILSSANAATASLATSVAGFDGSKDALVNSVGGIQGGTSTSQSGASRSTTTLSGRGSTLSPYQEHRVLQRVLKGLEQLDDGGGQVRLRLHPPELGSLQITLRVEAQQVAAMIEVEHSAARDVLLANLPQLQSRLADQGLNVSQFDVQVVDPNQFGSASGQGWESSNGQGAGQNSPDSNRASRYLERLRNQTERSPTGESVRSARSLWTRTNGELDVHY